VADKDWIARSWFARAKFGIFVHWGIYAVNGRDASWPFYKGEISYPDYMRQRERFRAERYDPKAWARLFRRSGARYAVLTSKHHDGFSLWDTRAGTLNVVRDSPAGRDLVGPWMKAMRAAGLKAGLYYSLADWSHPDYPTMNRKNGGGQGSEYSYPKYRDDPRAWGRFLRFMGGQLEELQRRFKPDLFWFDGDWERSARQWKAARLRAQLKRRQPSLVLNSRLQGYGDYATPEQAAPIHAPGGVWEFCMTMNDSWGYQKGGYKSLRQLLRTLTEIAGLGGNLLLNVGPRADGQIPREAAERLDGIGAWLRKNGEAIFGTEAGLPAGHLYGASTLSPDRKKLYAFLYDRPRDGFAIKGLRNPVKSVRSLHSGRRLQHRSSGGAPWQHKPGTLWIDLKAGDLDRDVTALKIELDGPLDLYSDLRAH
jgi:alpha-L-fucosidase